MIFIVSHLALSVLSTWFISISIFSYSNYFQQNRHSFFCLLSLTLDIVKYHLWKLMATQGIHEALDILVGWVFQRTTTAPLWKTEKTVMRGQTPITNNRQKAILEESMLIFETYVFVFNSVFHSMFILRCFCMDNGFPHVSFSILQYLPQVSREVTY